MKAQKFTAVFFLSITLIFMFLAPTSLVMKKIDKRIQERAEAQKVINAVKAGIDWAKLYPFEEYDDKYHETYQVHIDSETPFTYVKKRIDDYTSKSLLCRMTAVEAAKTYEELINWNIASVYEYNGVTKLRDGFLTGITGSADISPKAASIINFADWSRNKGIDFLYVNAPFKICIHEDQDITGILDFSNQNADRFLRRLSTAGVTNYDLRKILHAEGMKHHEAFYRTDHHWKTETGLWASRHILQFLRDNYGWNVEPEILNPDKFEHVV